MDNVTVTESPNVVNVSTPTETINVTVDDSIVRVTENDDQVNVSEQQLIVQVSEVTDVVNFQVKEAITIVQGSTGTIVEEQRLIDFIDDDIVYVGYAALGAVESDLVWKILRVTRDFLLGPACDLADDEDLYNKSWTDRLTYTF